MGGFRSVATVLLSGNLRMNRGKNASSASNVYYSASIIPANMAESSLTQAMPCISASRYRSTSKWRMRSDFDIRLSWPPTEDHGVPEDCVESKAQESRTYDATRAAATSFNLVKRTLGLPTRGLDWRCCMTMAQTANEFQEIATGYVCSKVRNPTGIRGSWDPTLAPAAWDSDAARVALIQIRICAIRRDGRGQRGSWNRRNFQEHLKVGKPVAVQDFPKSRQLIFG